MKSLLRLVASAAFSLMLVAGVSVSLTGCSADTLSGPDFEAFGTGGDSSGGTSGGGSDHNTENKTGGDSSGGTSGGGSDHNTDN